MFLNISSDYVQICDGAKTSLIHRNEVDQKLGPELVKIYREKKIEKIFVLNGPGGFTNLRVGTLCLNLLQTLTKNKIKIYQFTKQKLFQEAYKQKIIPKRGIVYIGQKKNLWHYNLEKAEYQEIKKMDIAGLDQEDLFLDLVFDKDYYEKDMQKNMIDINFDGKLNISFKSNKGNIDFGKISNKVEGDIEAKYFVEPIISKPKNFISCNK